MHRAFERCIPSTPNHAQSTQSLCWPIVNKNEAPPLSTGVEVSRDTVNWPVSEPWRRNLGQPRCAGQGRCQGDSQRCNNKYQRGVDDVGRCPSKSSCATSYSCRNKHVPRDQLCPAPCSNSGTCNRLTTRCFEWPIARQEFCRPADPNVDHRPPRINVMDVRIKPECCPTCNRTLVDLSCGPLDINYEN